MFIHLIVLIIIITYDRVKGEKKFSLASVLKINLELLIDMTQLC